MINELTVLNKLREVIYTKLNSYLENDLETFDDKNVIIDFPEVDKMPNKTAIYIQPNYTQYSNLSTHSDQSVMTISIYILCKRDNQHNLTNKVMSYTNALYEMVRTEMDLDGTIDFITPTDMDYYPAVEGNPNVRGVELTINCQFTKDY